MYGFECESGGARFVIAGVPAVGIFEARLEGRAFHFQHAGDLADVHGDRRHVEVFAEIVRLLESVAARLLNQVPRHARQGRLGIGCLGQPLHQLHLGERLRVADVERLAFGARLDHGPEHGLHQIVHVNELHQPVAIAGDDDGTAGAQPVPEKLLAIERVVGSVHERWAEGHDRQAVFRAHAEQQPFGGSFVPDVRVGVRIRRQRIAFLVVEPVAVSRHAGHKNVAAQPVAARPYGRFYLRRGSATLPIVDVVEHHFEAAAAQRLAHGFRVVAVGHHVLHPPPEIVLGLAVQNRDVMPRLDQFLDQGTADEERAADDQYFHTLSIS